MRLIDADELLDSIVVDIVIDGEENARTVYAALEAIINTIKAAPTINPGGEE